MTHRQDSLWTDSRKHLTFAGESYIQHLGFTLWFAGRLASLAVAAVLHGLVPSCHKTTGSDGIFALNRLLLRRRRIRAREIQAQKLIDGAGV